MISTFRVIASWLSKGALLFHAVGGVHVIALHAHVVHGVAHAIDELLLTALYDDAFNRLGNLEN
tara:strand:- start:298 stop:489 length:192 start_codon:yes stop_codon:yes gene_type:complete